MEGRLFLNESSIHLDLLGSNTSDYILRPDNSKNWSESLNIDVDFEGLTTTENYAVGAAYLSISAVGFIFNLLTIFVIGKGSHISNEVKLQIMNLAIADFLMASFGTIRIVLRYFRIPFAQNSALCKFIFLAEHASHYTSLLCNVAISLERFVIVYFPFKAAQYNQTHKVGTIILVWLCGSLSALELTMGADVVTVEGLDVCIDNSPMDLSSYQLYIWLCTLKYFLPTLVIVTTYILVFSKLCVSKMAGIKRSLSPQWKQGLDKVRIYCDS